MQATFKLKLALVLGVLTFLLALIVQAPATLLAYVLANNSQQQLTLANVQGTLWQGEGIVLLTKEQQQLALGKIKWQIAPLPLFLLKLEASLHWNEKPPSHIFASTQEVRIQELAWDIPANALGILIPSLNSASLGGTVIITSQQLRFNNHQFEGNANIEWQQASSALSQINPLGDYLLQLTGQDTTLNLQLTTLSGALLLNGNGQWSAQSGFSFNGIASSNKQAEALAPLLHNIGNQEVANSGQFRFTL